VIVNYWRFQRARDLESRTLNEEDHNPKLLSLYFRYRAAFEASFYRALRVLRQVKTENLRLIERFAKSRRIAGQFVSQIAQTPECQAPGPLDEAA
jgi:hypothetical protein